MCTKLSVGYLLRSALIRGQIHSGEEERKCMGMTGNHGLDLKQVHDKRQLRWVKQLTSVGQPLMVVGSLRNLKTIHVLPSKYSQPPRPLPGPCPLLGTEFVLLQPVGCFSPLTFTGTTVGTCRCILFPMIISSSDRTTSSQAHLE
jgi:hypothetical protein